MKSLWTSVKTQPKTPKSKQLRIVLQKSSCQTESLPRFVLAMRGHSPNCQRGHNPPPEKLCVPVAFNRPEKEASKFGNIPYEVSRETLIEASRAEEFTKVTSILTCP